MYNLLNECKIEIKEINRIINNDVNVNKEIMIKINKFFILKWKKSKRTSEINDFHEIINQEITTKILNECYLNK